MWEGCSGEPTHGEPYTGTKPETVDTAKGTDLQAAAATPYPIMAQGFATTEPTSAPLPEQESDDRVGGGELEGGASVPFRVLSRPQPLPHPAQPRPPPRTTRPPSRPASADCAATEASSTPMIRAVHRLHAGGGRPAGPAPAWVADRRRERTVRVPGRGRGEADAKSVGLLRPSWSTISTSKASLRRVS